MNELCLSEVGISKCLKLSAYVLCQDFVSWELSSAFNFYLLMELSA